MNEGTLGHPGLRKDRDLTWFALATYQRDRTARSALVLNETLYDLVDTAKLIGIDGALRDHIHSVDRIVAHWNALADDVGELADAATVLDLPPASGQLLTPFAPYRLFGAASNYIEHAAEMETKLAAKADSTPFIFMKSQGSVIGPDEPVILPRESQKVDWEVELGVVIGRAGRRISVDRAHEHIAGYVVVNDVSARDLTRRTDFPFSHDWFRGKSFDSFTPVGPWFVPASCIADPHALSLKLSVNDELMQDGVSGHMIFNSYEQIAYLSTLLELRPGDLIATGTPAGVGMGRGIFLKAGDTMVASIEGIGSIVNPVIAEQA